MSTPPRGRDGIRLRPPAGADLPPLVGHPEVRAGGWRLSGPSTDSLRGTRFDTAGGRLTRSRVQVLRTDTEWHVLVPTDDQPAVFRTPGAPGSDELPEELRPELLPWLRDEPLVPVGSVVLQRLALDVECAADGRTASVIDVRGTTTDYRDPGAESAVQWHDWVLDGSGTLGAQLQDFLCEVGAVRRPDPGSEWFPSSPAPGPPGRAQTGDPTASDVLLRHLRSQRDAMLVRDRQVRGRDPVGVHKMRVATRQLRSGLGTFRSLLDRSVADPLRDELKWIAGLLGQVRDADVLRQRLLERLDAEPAELVLGPVAADVSRDLTLRATAAHQAIAGAMTSERYFRLLDGLDRLVEGGSLGPPAGRSAARALRKPVRRRWRRLHAQIRAVEAGGGPDRATPTTAEAAARDTELHECRKAAKRFRYALEAVAEVYGPDADGLADLAQGVQKVLGEHQDSVVARDYLRQAAVSAHGIGANTFTYGRLHQQEQDLAAAARGGFGVAAHDLRRHVRRSWLGG